MPDTSAMAPDASSGPEEIPVCPSAQLEEGGKGQRFAVSVQGRDAVGFVVRFGGAVYGYLNRCAHVPIEMDWEEGQFFESGGRYIMCATHGAVYEPTTGKCAGGPCRGASLYGIVINEHDGQIFWTPDDFIRPALA